MSFANDLYTLMTSSSAVNAAVDGVYFQIIPDNTGTDEVDIVYTFSQIDSIDHLARNNEIDIYNLNIIVLAPDTAEADGVVTILRAYLDNYTSTAFLDIKYQTSEISIEGEREQYIITLNYKITYYPTFGGN